MENLRQELSLKHQSEMEGLQSQFQKELSEQKVELEKIFQAKEEAEGEPPTKASISGAWGAECPLESATRLAFSRPCFQRELLGTYIQGYGCFIEAL